jgi:hypothetical protein
LNPFLFEIMRIWTCLAHVSQRVPSTSRRFESAASLLATPWSDAVERELLQPVLDTGGSALSASADLLASVEFLSSAVLGSIVRVYDPRRMCLHRLVGASLVHSWALVDAYPHAIPSSLASDDATARRVALSEPLMSNVAAVSSGAVLARLVAALPLVDTEPLALQTLDEFRTTTVRMAASVRAAPQRAKPTDEQLDLCERWLAHSCSLLQQRVRLAFSNDVSHDLLMRRRSAAASSPPKHARR